MTISGGLQWTPLLQRPLSKSKKTKYKFPSLHREGPGEGWIVSSIKKSTPLQTSPHERGGSMKNIELCKGLSFTKRGWGDLEPLAQYPG